MVLAIPSQNLGMEKIGKYKVIREIGVGATSTVYLAIDPFTEQQVAIKLFDLDKLLDHSHARKYRKLLMTEASLAGKLCHPHIAQIQDAVMEEEQNYMVMEFIDGCTLEQYVDVDHLLSISTISEIIYKCCKALEYAQYQGVIHRDIKPANILLQGETDIKISDFGAAVLRNNETTTQVAGIGSPAYMSPEQVQEKNLTHQTDIYSLGAVMYHLLTGNLPFNVNNSLSMVYHILNVDPTPPSMFRHEIPAELDAIVMKAMEKEQDKRYQTWDDFAQDLVAFFSNNAPQQEEVFETEKFDLLRQLQFFKHFDEIALWEMLRISRWQKIPRSTHILHQGEDGASFYILAGGSVKVEKQGTLLNILHKGDCFGEMAHLSEEKFTRSTDIIAREDVLIIELDPEMIENTTTECRLLIGDAFLRLLVRRLADANTRISKLTQTQQQDNKPRSE